MKKNGILKLAILSISFLLMLRLTISPALAEIGKAFPQISQGSLMMMVALPSLVAIPFGFFSGILANFMRKRTILFVALTLFLIGGVGPMFTNNYTIILVLRSLLGAGTGLFLPFAAGLIADFFTGDERNAMIGYQSTAVAVGNIITSLLAGVLATISWKLSFLIYAFAVISLILVIFKLPEPERVQHAPAEKKTLNARVLFICFGIFLYAIVYFSFFGYLSFVVDSHHLGNAASTGVATMLMTVGSIIMGIVFGKLTKVLKRYAMVVALIGNIIGFFTLSSATSIIHIFIGAFFIGLGFGFLMPLATMKVTDASSKSAITFSNGLFMTFVNIGTAVSPTILVAVGNIFKNSDGQFIYLFCSISLAVAAVISLILAFLPQKEKSELTSAI